MPCLFFHWISNWYYYLSDLLPLLDINVYCSFWSSAFFNSASFVSYYFPQRLKFMADFCFDFFYFLAQVAIYFLALCVLICSQHWNMVISIPNKEDESQPILLYLDSLGLQPSKCIFENIRRWIEFCSSPIIDFICYIDIQQSSLGIDYRDMLGYLCKDIYYVTYLAKKLYLQFRKPGMCNHFHYFRINV